MSAEIERLQQALDRSNARLVKHMIDVVTAPGDPLPKYEATDTDIFRVVFETAL